MKSLIIGGGKVGYHLLHTLYDNGYDVALIEKNSDICSKIAEDIDAEIYCGDATDVDVLEDAGIAEADIVAAVTGTDEENLVICEIAKVCFGIGKTIARINNPKNRETFRALGVDTTVCSTTVIADLIESEFNKNGYRIVQMLDRGAMLLVEIFVDATSKWSNAMIRDLHMPNDSVIASVLRADAVIFPKGDTLIQSGDHILMITNNSTLSELRKYLKH